MGKRVIRYNIWESNSSSSHTVSVSMESSINIPKVNPDEKITMSFGEFGWEWETYYDIWDKLQYALEMVYETEVPWDLKSSNDYDEVLEAFYETEGFKDINEVIKDELNCSGIEMELNYDAWYPFGYIDHQSFEDYGCLQDFLNDYGVDLYRFLFDGNVVLRTGNDNG